MFMGIYGCLSVYGYLSVSMGVYELLGIYGY